jgi:hypothetical protein
MQFAFFRNYCKNKCFMHHFKLLPERIYLDPSTKHDMSQDYLFYAACPRTLFVFAAISIYYALLLEGSRWHCQQKWSKSILTHFENFRSHFRLVSKFAGNCVSIISVQKCLPGRLNLSLLDKTEERAWWSDLHRALLIIFKRKISKTAPMTLFSFLFS